MLASWSGQYESYRSELLKNLSHSVLTIPIFQDKVNNIISSPIYIPSYIFDSYTEMELDMIISCPGNYDQNCAQWDHCVTISVSCADASSSFNEKLNLLSNSPPKLKLQPKNTLNDNFAQF